MELNSTTKGIWGFYVKYGIKPCYALVAHLQSNGQVEVINKTLKESIMKLSFYELEINEKYGNVFRDVLGGVLNELSLMISKVTDNYHYYTFPIEASSREIILPVLIQKMDNAIDSQSYKEFEKIFKLYCDQMLILEPDMLMQKIEKTNRILACESIEDLDIRDKKLYILLNSHMNEYQELVAQSMRYGH